MDAMKLLKEQHDEVAANFKRFEKSGDTEEKRELFELIADSLAAHTTIEEKIFYPAVYVGDTAEKLEEAVEAHLAAKRVIADLLEMDVEDPQFDAKMQVLKEEVEHHVEEEEGELFKTVSKDFSSQEIDSLGNEMQRMFDELKDSEPRNNVPEETDRAAPLT